MYSTGVEGVKQKKEGASRRFPRLADRAFLEALVVSVADLIQLDAVDLGDSTHPRALAAVEQARSALGAERLTDLGGGPTFFSCLVEVEKCGD